MAAFSRACSDQGRVWRQRRAARLIRASRLGLPPGMAEARQKELTGVLEELCQAVAADGGAALHLDDGEGVLQRVAFTVACGARSPRLLDRFRNEGHDKHSLVLSIPGSIPGVILLNRMAGGNFTQQDRAVARLYVRRLSEVAGAA